ncbi:Hsp20/alpha crystallin family protein [Candidatus Uhrbacteria bacterium]|nr:Hsp20/alpha crystallin family protein [Candidatus Uhrbacteria bacterium]
MSTLSTPPDWLQSPKEGQLSLDVFREKGELVIRSLVAGVKPEDLDVSLHGDLLTIRGSRCHPQEISDDDWYYRECYWGGFSRSVVLPYEIAADAITATLKNGILEVRLPIREHGKKVKVKWKE